MIAHDAEFKQALEALNIARQRQVGAAFVRHVLALNPAVTRAVEAAAHPETPADEMALAFQQAKAAALENYTRCGADCDWQAQAGYFVARAAAALVAPEKQLQSPAWEAAANARLARTCGLIDTASTALHEESEAQYRILTQFLNDFRG